MPQPKQQAFFYHRGLPAAWQAGTEFAESEYFLIKKKCLTPRSPRS